MIKKPLVISSLALVFALSVVATSYAVDDTTSEDTSTSNNRSDHSHSRIDNAEKREAAKQRMLEKREARQEKREELREKVQQLKADRTEKLEGKRQEICEKREEKINSLLSNSVKRAEKRLAFIDKVNDRLNTFYENRDLSSDDYTAASEKVAEKAGAAKAALEVMANEKFSCDKVDGEKPGLVIREVVQARNNAMKEYREAVRELLQVVREAFQNRDKDTSTDARAEEVQ